MERRPRPLAAAEIRDLVDAGCTCTRVRRLARRVTQFYDRALADTGLRVTQYSLLSNLRECGAMPIGRLATMLDMDRTTLTRNLRPLLEAGYVTLDAAEGDARTRVAALTRAGHRQHAMAGDAWLRAQRDINAVFGPEHIDRLHRTFDGLIDRLNAQAT